MQTPLLVVSCDKYSDLWAPFFYYFNKHWPNFQGEKYLLTDKQSFPNKYGVKVIHTDAGKDWSGGLLEALSHFSNYDSVLLFLEDMLLSQSIDQNRFLKIESFFEQNDASYLTLLDEPKGQKSEYDEIEVLPKGSLYRCTATAAVWNIRVLKHILLKGESAWAFEKNASVRSDDFSGFFNLNPPLVYWTNSVIKGAYTPEGYSKILQAEIEPDHNRLKWSNFRMIRHNLYRLMRRFFLKLVPSNSQRIFFQKYK